METNKNTDLLKKITSIFYRCGIKSVTMDDIAKDLCISKKTLYQYFKDKNDIIEQIVSYHIESMECDLSTLYDDKDNAIDVLLIVSKYITEQLQRIHPSVTFDLQKYYPEAWRRHTDFRKLHIINDIKKNMEIGIQQGYYRNDFNIDLIARYYLARIENLFQDESLIKDYTFEEIFNTFFIYHIRGIANLKGIEYLENKIKQNFNK